MTFMEARIIAARSEIDAILVRVEGMKALNARRIDRGETTAYNEEAFLAESALIAGLAQEIMGFAQQL